jgi:hypothetical protein
VGGTAHRSAPQRPMPPALEFILTWFLDLVEADRANRFVRRLAEATLTLVLFCDAVRVNLGRLRHESAVPGRLLGSACSSPFWPAPRPGWPCSPS